MAGNTFDFELNADDQASQEIANIEAELNKLRPVLKDVRESLRMGGDESISGLRDVGDRIRDMSDFSKKGAQSIGDMIPPLKNFGELSSKYMGMAKKIGGIGAVGYAAYQVLNQVPAEAKKATEISTSAKNTGMSIEESTRLAGVLNQRGVAMDESRGIMEGQYEQFSRAQKGDDNELRESIRSIGAEIITNKDGSVDMVATLTSLESAIEKLPEHRNWELRDKLKLPPEIIALLREGKLRYRLDKSDAMGHTRKSSTINALSELDVTFNEIASSLEGAMTKTKDRFWDFALTDGPYLESGVSDGLNGVQQIIEHGPDNFAIMQTLGVNTRNESDALRQTYNTPELYNKLSFGGKVSLDFGVMTDEIQKNYDEWEKAKAEIKAKEKKAAQVSTPASWKQDNGYDPKVRAFRNRNPGNVREADNQIGLDGAGSDRFAIFNNDDDGLSALARQILLYMDRGNNTIDGFVNTYAPGADGNYVEGYIKHLTGYMGVDRNTPLNLYDTDVLSKMMTGIIKQESGYQPYSYERIQGSIDESINNPRWSGRRYPDKLLAQREEWAEKQSSPIISPPEQLSGQEIVDSISKAIREALAEGQNNSSIEITLTNKDTGTRQTLNTKPKGKVTTAMNMP